MEIEIRTEINEIRDKYLLESSVKKLVFQETNEIDKLLANLIKRYRTNRVGRKILERALQMLQIFLKASKRILEIFNTNNIGNLDKMVNCCKHITYLKEVKKKEKTCMVPQS